MKHTTMKAFLVLTCALIAILGISSKSDAKAFDEADLTFLGGEAYTDENGITHCNDGRCWGPDGIVFFEDELETIEENLVAMAAAPDFDDEENFESSIGSAIWMDAYGITHTSDGLAWGPNGVVYDDNLGPAIYMDANGVTHCSNGLAWGPDGVVYIEDDGTGTGSSGFCYNHDAIIGSALWMDELGQIHDSDNTCYVKLTIDENGVLTSNMGNLNMAFAAPVSIIVNQLFSTHQILVQILDADTCVELLAIVITLPM